MALVQVPAPSAGEDWTLLNTGGTSLSGSATVTVSGINKAKLMIVVQDATSTTTGQLVGIRFNSDSGSNYKHGGVSHYAPSAYATSILNIEPEVSTSRTHVYLARRSGNSGSIARGYCLVTGCNSATGVKIYQAAGSAGASTSNNHQAYVTGGFYDSTTAITSISVVSLSGNFNGGTVFVYGTD